MKRFGIVSYNIYCNFTNYGSALQSWALHQAIDRLGGRDFQSVLVDYCPDILRDKDPLDPMKAMWDQDEVSQRMCRLSLPAIRENYYKFDNFYRTQFRRTEGAYTSENFNDIVGKENLDGFVCGSDTVFCIDEFGFDDGYYANYDCMKNRSVAYAASFGDAHFGPDTYPVLDQRLQNFRAFGLREKQMVPYVREHTQVPVENVCDPTLLLSAEDYDTIAAPSDKKGHLLLYARRYNRAMEAYAEKLAAEKGWEIVEISLRATNAEKPGRTMAYEAGVEEFLSLVRNAEFVVTNSFHGMIFSVQYRRPFYVFSREQCDTKIMELLEFFGLSDRMRVTGLEPEAPDADYDAVHGRIATKREMSRAYLKQMLSERL